MTGSDPVFQPKELGGLDKKERRLSRNCQSGGSRKVQWISRRYLG